MPGYSAFDNQSVIEFIKQKTNLFASDAMLTAAEFGDGNLNLVFRVEDASGKSVIVKQALPYARCVGESWPLTLDRARIEAEVLQNHGKLCPEYTVAVLHQDNELAVTVLEDLGNMQILRTAQNNAEQFAHLAEHVGTYLAKTAFFNSDFYLEAQQKKAMVQQFTNPELCQITEDLFFTDPYTTHERNNYAKALEPVVQQLQHNARVKLAVAKLKAKFLSCPQTLLHGDVHSGSIFVDPQRTKLIDPEFGYFGPMGFDIGSFIGNQLLNYCAQNGRIEDEQERQAMQDHLLDVIKTTYQTFESLLQTLLKEQTRDVALAQDEYQAYFLQSVLQDAAGYAGTELIRRVIGLAHVSDIDSIADETQRLAVQIQALELGQTLILNSEQINDFSQWMDLMLTVPFGEH